MYCFIILFIYFNFIFNYFLHIHLYLLEIQIHRKEECQRQMSPIHWLIPQVAAMGGSQLIQSQECGASSWSLKWIQAPRLWVIINYFPKPPKESWMESRAAWTQTKTYRDPSVHKERTLFPRLIHWGFYLIYWDLFLGWGWFTERIETKKNVSAYLHALQLFEMTGIE